MRTVRNEVIQNANLYNMIASPGTSRDFTAPFDHRAKVKTAKNVNAGEHL